MLRDVHAELPLPAGATDEDTWLARGDYLYFHYGCDGLDDRGWGCGYRTLQTLCSWVQYQRLAIGKSAADVPSLPRIQEILVAMGDKGKEFIGSKTWIGSVEVGLVIDDLYDVPCKILHMESGHQLQHHLADLKKHFQDIGSPVMMGGDFDNSSKGIFGVCCDSSSSYLLVLLHVTIPFGDMIGGKGVILSKQNSTKTQIFNVTFKTLLGIPIFMVLPLTVIPWLLQRCSCGEGWIHSWKTLFIISAYLNVSRDWIQKRRLLLTRPSYHNHHRRT